MNIAPPMPRLSLEKKSTSATSAPVRTSRPSCSMRACPPPTSVPKALTASTTPPSTTLPGSPRMPTRTSSTCRRWRGSSAWKRCAWPMPTCCPTTTRPTPARSRSYLDAAKRKAADAGLGSLDFAPGTRPPRLDFAAAAARAHTLQAVPSGNLAQLNQTLRQIETALALPARPAQSPLVPAHHLCSRRIHRLRGRGHSRRQRGHRRQRRHGRRAAVDGPDPGSRPGRANP